MSASPPSKLFIIYAREDHPALLELKAHLRPLEKRGDLAVWYDGELLPGQDWDRAIKDHLEAADIVLLFISKYFFNSEYIEREELKKALDRHKKNKILVVPVIVKPCLWEANPDIRALQALPANGKAISTWGDMDEAFSDVARGIQKMIPVKIKPSENHEFMSRPGAKRNLYKGIRPDSPKPEIKPNSNWLAGNWPLFLIFALALWILYHTLSK